MPSVAEPETRAQPPRRGRTVAPAVGAGVLIAISVPPVGLWPAGIAGVGLLGWQLAGRPARTRALIGFAGGIGLYGVTLAWMSQFNLIGGVLVMMLEASFLCLAALATPPGRGRRAAWVGALVIQDWLRSWIPFGGVPLGGIPLGQAAGPLAPVARLGGPLLVTGVTALAGLVLEGVVTAVAATLRRARTTGGGADAEAAVRVGAATFPAVAVALVSVVVVVALAVGGLLAPGGRSVAPLRVALVQGGGRRGLRAVENPASKVLAAAFDASALIRAPVDLVLWPEDVIAMDGPIQGTRTAEQVGQVAVANRAALLAGVTETVGADKFRNAEVVWDGTGHITGRFDKVHRVPFGEYVPGRSLVAKLVDLGVIPRDAIPGRGTGEVSTQAGPVGIVISYEIYFANRARTAIRAGGEVLLAPTNTASYTTSQVPSSELAAAKLRAWETGRDVIMAAPTGFSAVIDSRGRLLERSTLGRREVLTATVHRRVGLTPYLRWGDGPVLMLSLALAAAGWTLALLDQSVNSSKP